MRRYYQILGVPPYANPAEIKEAWLFSLKAFHPDKFSGSSKQQQAVANERTKAINEAYAVLSDPIKRAAYDYEFLGTARTKSSSEPPPGTQKPSAPVASWPTTRKSKIMASIVACSIFVICGIIILGTLPRKSEHAISRIAIDNRPALADATADFAKYAMKLRAQSLLKVKPQVFVPTKSRFSSSHYPWKSDIVTSVFWIGQPVSANQPLPRDKSAWDPDWKQNYGGVDNPDAGRRHGYIPINFAPRQNPFYIALPYNDVTQGQFKPEAPLVVPWFRQAFVQQGHSVCKDRWVAIRKGNRVCYAQWEDCGPFRTDHYQYVFRNERPTMNLNHGTGLDVSPAVRDYLGLGSISLTDWQFVEVRDVPPGPWRNYGDNNPYVIARRQSEQMTP